VTAGSSRTAAGAVRGLLLAVAAASLATAVLAPPARGPLGPAAAAADDVRAGVADDRRAQRRRGSVSASYRRMRARWHAPAPAPARRAFAQATPKPLVLVPVANRRRRRVLFPIGGRPRGDDAGAEAVAPEDDGPDLTEEELDALEGDAVDDEAALEAELAEDGADGPVGAAAEASPADADADDEDPWARVERLLDQRDPWTDEEAAFVHRMMEAVDGHVGGPIPPWDEVTPGVSRFDDPDELALAREALAYRKDGSSAPIHPRLLELVYRAVLHFEAPYVHVISGYRPTRRTSRHAQGRAIDLVLPGVSDRRLARFLSEQGFVGVGIYPKSGFVHLDVRAQSYFWIDRSAPGRRQRLRRILVDHGHRMDVAARRRGEERVPDAGAGRGGEE